MENSDWWKPQNLKKSEKNFRNENELGEVDVHNDFGSYIGHRLYSLLFIWMRRNRSED